MKKYKLILCFFICSIIFLIAPNVSIAGGFKLPKTFEVTDEDTYQPMPFYYVHRINRVTTSQLPDLPPVPSSSLTPFSNNMGDIPFEPPLFLLNHPKTIRDKRKVYSPYYNPPNAWIPAWSR